MESNYPVITNVFDTDWCNHLWGDATPTSARDKGVSMESQHANLHQGGPEAGYVSFKNEPEHRDLLMQEVHMPSDISGVGNSSIYPLQPSGLQNSGKNSRKCRARFTREEERLLLAGVVERWDELYGYQSQALPRGAKTRIWSDIAARLSASSREPREGEDVRKKWLYTKLTLRNRLRAANQLGLGTCPPDLSPLEQRVLALMGHDSGGSVDAPDVGFGPVSGEDFRPLGMQSAEDLDTVGSTSDTEIDGGQDEPQEEPAPTPFVPAPVAPVSTPSPVSNAPSASTSASNSQRKNARPEDPLVPALAAIKSRQDRSISLYKEAIAVLRSLAADVRRYVDHMLTVTALDPMTTPEGVSQGASASKQPAPPTATSGQSCAPQPLQAPTQAQPRSTSPPQTQHSPPPTATPASSLPRVPTPAERPPSCQPPSETPTPMCPQLSSAPPPQTAPRHPARPAPPQYPPSCSYHIVPHLPAMAYPAYYPSPHSSMCQFPQQTAAPPIYQYPPAVTVIVPPAPPPFAPHAVLHHSPSTSFYPAPPSAPSDPALSTTNCDPLHSHQAASQTLITSAPVASSHHPYQSGRGRGRGWLRKRWGRRGGSAYPSGRSSLPC
ncbi:hypothetical protein JZ751_008292 [Albula glossodonta]|uniref:Myb-like domain-containing protein n=1 Tax=Albula glossodonta TaxID=121402 RepID=A0A8T2N4H5_9TELE|nr:hypothetical protein JZ751_008292 [Albula glossodonta]